MNRKTMAILIVALAALLAWSGGSSGGGSLAQGEGGVAPQAVLTPLLQYQGRLADPGTGEPVADGDYTMTFRLYDVASGGSALWTETKDVPVADGLFNTVLGDVTALEQDLFNGRALWLGVKVGADGEATPRQQVLPVAYALSLVPGARVTGESDGQPVLRLNHTGDGNALIGVTDSTNPYRTAVFGLNNGGGAGVGGYTNSDESAAVGGYNNGTGPGVSGESVLGSGGYFSSTSGLALHAVGAATVTGDLNVGGDLIGGSHNHSGAHITSGTVADARVASTIARDSEIMPTVLANDGAGSTLDADRLDGSHASAFAGASHTHDTRYYTEGESESRYVNVTGDTMNGQLVVLASVSHGISSQTSSSASGAAGVEGKNTGSGYGVLGGSEASHGVYGYSTATSGGYGVYGSAPSRGVYGSASAATGTTYGVYGYSSSTSGRGVYGYSSSSYGVYGSSSSGTGVRGFATASSGTNYGVYGSSSSGTGYGVYGAASASSGYNYGMYGSSNSTLGVGVFGAATAASGTTSGVHGRSDSGSGYGVRGSVMAASGNRYGVYGWVNGTGYGLYSADNLYVAGSCTGCTMVFIARNTGQDVLRVGDVVAASGVGPVLAGHTAPVLEVRHATDSDTFVLGVVYSRGEFYAASGEQEGDGDSVQPVEGDAAPGDYLLVVTSGLAQVRVAPGLTGLTPGQRLTAGEVAGLATLAGADAKLDLVFARAMEAKPDENGLLWALVSTQ